MLLSVLVAVIPYLFKSYPPSLYLPRLVFCCFVMYILRIKPY